MVEYKHDGHYVYLILSFAPGYKGRSNYVGYTADPKERLRQHNGIAKLKNGPRSYTHVARPWRFVCFVTGFVDRAEGIKFETAVKENSSSLSGKGLTPIQRRAARMVLEINKFCRANPQRVSGMSLCVLRDSEIRHVLNAVDLLLPSDRVFTLDKSRVDRLNSEDELKCTDFRNRLDTPPRVKRANERKRKAQEEEEKEKETRTAETAASYGPHRHRRQTLHSVTDLASSSSSSSASSSSSSSASYNPCNPYSKQKRV